MLYSFFYYRLKGIKTISLNDWKNDGILMNDIDNKTQIENENCFN